MSKNQMVSVSTFKGWFDCGQGSDANIRNNVNRKLLTKVHKVNNELPELAIGLFGGAIQEAVKESKPTKIPRLNLMLPEWGALEHKDVLNVTVRALDASSKRMMTMPHATMPPIIHCGGFVVDGTTRLTIRAVAGAVYRLYQSTERMEYVAETGHSVTPKEWAILREAGALWPKIEVHEVSTEEARELMLGANSAVVVADEHQKARQASDLVRKYMGTDGFAKVSAVKRAAATLNISVSAVWSAVDTIKYLDAHPADLAELQAGETTWKIIMGRAGTDPSRSQVKLAISAAKLRDVSKIKPSALDELRESLKVKRDDKTVSFRAPKRVEKQSDDDYALLVVRAFCAHVTSQEDVGSVDYTPLIPPKDTADAAEQNAYGERVNAKLDSVYSTASDGDKRTSAKRTSAKRTGAKRTSAKRAK